MFGQNTLTIVLLVIPLVVLAMATHEAMHAFASNWLGDDTAKMQGRLTLNPLAHIDPLTTVALPVLLALAGVPPFAAAKPVPFNPYRVRYGEYGAAIVGVAGPLTNLFLALFFSGIVRMAGLNESTFLGSIIILFIVINIGTFVFNMIPFPPLDGSRLLYAFAPEPLKRIMEQIESMGFMAIVLFMFLIFNFIREPVYQIMQNIFYLLTGLRLS